MLENDILYLCDQQFDLRLREVLGQPDDPLEGHIWVESNDFSVNNLNRCVNDGARCELSIK